MFGSCSATARSTIDTCRTLGIWLVSLGLGWETLQWPFSALQVLGFGLLVYGTVSYLVLVPPLIQSETQKQWLSSQFVFNNLVLPPSFVRQPPGPSAAGGGQASSENAPLLGGEEEATDAATERRLEETAVLPSELGRGGFDVLPPPQRGD